jgi:hypothetical protein
MFETTEGSALTAWRSPSWPIDQPVSLTRLADHRREYLDYQGPLSGDRGFVKRIAGGLCRAECAADEPFWTIRFQDPFTLPLYLKQHQGDDWLAIPDCGGGGWS